MAQQRRPLRCLHWFSEFSTKGLQNWSVSLNNGSKKALQINNQGSATRALTSLTAEATFWVRHWQTDVTAGGGCIWQGLRPSQVLAVICHPQSSDGPVHCGAPFTGKHCFGGLPIEEHTRAGHSSSSVIWQVPLTVVYPLPYLTPALSSTTLLSHVYKIRQKIQERQKRQEGKELVDRVTLSHYIYTKESQRVWKILTGKDNIKMRPLVSLPFWYKDVLWNSFPSNYLGPRVNPK